MEGLNFIIVREGREDGFEEKVIADKAFSPVQH
jgi:hypothetical protein